jgi:hypothetical protein
MSKQVYCQLHDIESLDHKAKAHKDCHLEAEQEVLENRQMKEHHYIVYGDMHLRKKLDKLAKRTKKKNNI